MAKLLQDLSSEIIERIKKANSQSDVKCLLEKTIMNLKETNLDENSLSDFASIIIKELDQFSPMNKNPQEWSNIRFSKVILNRILLNRGTN